MPAPFLVLTITENGTHARVTEIDPATAKQRDRSSEFLVKQLCVEADDGVYAGFFVCTRVEPVLPVGATNGEALRS